MLDLFRRLTKSKIGIVVFGLFIAALALGFVAADMQNLGVSGAASGDTVAKVGREEVTYVELQQRVQRAYDNARQERPDLTIQQFVRQGGVDQVLSQIGDGLALEQFAKAQGFGVSRKMEDGQIAAAPAFRGLNGQFDQTAFEGFLNQQRVSEKQLRRDLARDLYVTQLIVPVTGATLAPATLTLPYASMLLEARSGRQLFVPAAALRGAPPTDAELNDFYRRNIARYTIPERRMVRYALIDRASTAAASVPNETEIAKAYQDNKAAYGARETRTISQVILADEAAARALAARVAAGTPIADGARAAGLESVTLTEQTRETYLEASSAAVADAVFAAAQGAVAAPARSGLGWHVVRVDAVKTIPGRTIDQARGEIVERLGRGKADQAMADAIAKIEDAIADGATFDEVVAANRLQAVVTPPLLADGRNPQAPDAIVALELTPVLKAAFAAEVTDDPTVEQIAANQSYALVKADRVVPPAPRPLADIRGQVAADLIADRSLAAARRVAEAIAAKVNAGTPLAQAVAGAGVSLPAATPINGRRGELLQRERPAMPQLAALFATRPGKARIVAAPDRSGWHVIQLEQVTQGDARTQPQLIQATRSQFAPVLGQEYGQQLAAAVRKSIGVEINGAAVARLKSELIGGSSPAR